MVAEALVESPEQQGIVGVRSYMLALELNLGSDGQEVERAGRFRFRLADDVVDPRTGLWLKEPLGKEEQRKLPAWRCDQLGGQFYILHGEANRDTQDFYLVIRGELQCRVNESGLVQADLWPPLREEYDDLQKVEVTWNNERMRVMEGIRYDYENMRQGRHHWRLCADKAACAWRIRDEELNDPSMPGALNGNLWEVQDYRGLVNGSRLKPTETHIFHDGELQVDQYGVAWFLAEYEE